MIPKVNSPEKVAQFRANSLCNVVYKVISKKVVGHLKVILPKVISPIESAFVRGRMITDNVLVAYECFHTIRTRGRAKRVFVLLNLTCTEHTIESSGLS